MELNKIYQGDTLKVLKTFPSDFVDTIITSPPYWGLRDYGTAKWVGGDPNCNHRIDRFGNRKVTSATKIDQSKQKSLAGEFVPVNGICPKCGAKRIDLQIGLEKTLDEYLAKMLAVTAELQRVLKPTGVMFWNHGDCYCGSQGHFDAKNPKAREGKLIPHQKNYQAKCLFLQNYRLILKMIDEQDWILRNVLVWYKPNAMPSSVKDRFSNSYENVFMLVKNKKYWFDLDAVRAKHKEPWRSGKKESSNPHSGRLDDKGKQQAAYVVAERKYNPTGKNPGDIFAVPFDYTPGFLTREEAAYIAGLFDGDGSITLQEKKTNDCMFLTIVSTDKGVTDWLKKTLGFGRIYKRKRDPKWLPTYEFNVYSSKAAAVLYAIYPWLIIKKERAKTALEFQSLGVGVGQQIDDWAKARRKELIKEMHELNQKRLMDSSSPNPMGDANIEADVWKIPTQPFPEAHFATFPEKLVEPMIKSSCPEFICKKCGKARVRIGEKVYEKAHSRGKNYKQIKGTNSRASGKAWKDGGWNELPALKIKEVKTIGWTDCGCGKGWRSGIVLDCFMGSGTSALVARKHGRNWIGIELSKAYIKIAQKRLAQQSLFENAGKTAGK